MSPLYLPPALEERSYSVCTSSTRPSSPYEGYMIYETDTDLVRTYSGSTWNVIGGNTPIFYARRSAAQSITSSSDTRIDFNSVVSDTHGYFDSTTNYRFTPLIAGYYSFSAACSFSPAADAMRMFLILRKNGASLYRTFSTAAAAIDSGVTVSGFMSLNGSTDFADVAVNQNSGTAKNTGATTDCYLTGYWVRPL